jgi:murein DD-endopeptidase MepM/ murein hydrolase activator NlpD
MRHRHRYFSPRRLASFLAALVLFPLMLSAEERIHTLQRGETIYSIARAYGVSVQDILRLNGIVDAAKVQAGQRIRIPVQNAGGGTGGYSEHRVVRGETLYSIARRYGITLQELLDLNGLLSSYVLKEGDKLRVSVKGTAVANPPVSGGAPAASGPPAAVRPAVQQRPDASIRWPVAAREVSYMTGKLYGVMLAGERSEPVKSLTQGTVVSAGPYRGFGRVAIVQMTGGYLYVYGGCESLSVKEGDRVIPGAELGRLGIDAKSEKAQLFLLVYRNNSPIDPARAPRG